VLVAERRKEPRAFSNEKKSLGKKSGGGGSGLVSQSSFGKKGQSGSSRRSGRYREGKEEKRGKNQKRGARKKRELGIVGGEDLLPMSLQKGEYKKTWKGNFLKKKGGTNERDHRRKVREVFREGGTGRDESRQNWRHEKKGRMSYRRKSCTWNGKKAFHGKASGIYQALR